MIEINRTTDLFPLDLFSKKITIILEDQNKQVNREDIITFVTDLEANKYYGMVGRENNMIPFLSILDNLLLGISKKQKEAFLNQLSDFLEQFKLTSLDLNETAQILSKHEQLVLQMIRALILKQTIIIFDVDNTRTETDQFLLHLMPILKRIIQKYEATIIISSNNKDLVDSIYYDQCLLIENYLKKNS